MIPTFSLEKAYNEVLGRLARYKDMNPQLTLNVVADKHFMVTMASEADEAKIEERIESKLINIADQLQREKEALERDAEIKGERLEDEKKKRETAEIESEKAKQELEAFKTESEKAKQELEAFKTESEKAKQELETLKASLVKWIKWAGFVVGLGLTSSLLWLHQYWWLYWPWLDTHKNRTPIELAFQLLLVFAFLNIPLSRHWKVWLPLVIAIMLAILKLAFL